MLTVLLKAFSFILIILTGFLLKKCGFFQPKDFFLVSKLVINLVLPCAIITNFSRIQLDTSMLSFCAVGFGANVLMLILGYVTNLKGSSREKSFAIINSSGYNIGSFTTPFVQAFLSPVGFVVTSMFDTGNAIICSGANYAVASAVQGDHGASSPSSIFKNLFHSAPFVTYVSMTIFSLLGIHLPKLVLDYTSTVGSANAFLAMLAIGIGFDINLDTSRIRVILRILGSRYLLTGLFAVIAWFSPCSLEARQALVIVFLGPLTSLCPAFTGKLNNDVELSSVINSLSIIISIVLMTSALVLMNV